MKSCMLKLCNRIWQFSLNSAIAKVVEIFKKDHGTVAKAIYECAKSAAPQSDNRITEVGWDPKGLVNGDNSRPADIHCKINQKDHAFDVTVLHTRTSTHRNIYEDTDRAIKAKEHDK